MTNRKLQIAIVEDQQENIDILKYYFEQHSDRYEVKHIALTSEDARRVLSAKNIDLALLDIDLGEETIFDVLNDIDHSHLNHALIFVTAHGTFENALQAIRYSCLNFITKPIDFDELESTLQKVLNERNKSNLSQIDILLDMLKDKTYTPQKIGIVLSKGIIQFVKCNDIMYVCADDILSHIFLYEKDKLVSTRHLGYYDNLLNNHGDFIRIHKSILVNKNHIVKLDSRNRMMIMSNQEGLEISKRRLSGVLYSIKSK